MIPKNFIAKFTKQADTIPFECTYFDLPHELHVSRHFIKIFSSKQLSLLCWQKCSSNQSLQPSVIKINKRIRFYIISYENTSIFLGLLSRVSQIIALSSQTKKIKWATTYSHYVDQKYDKNAKKFLNKIFSYPT